MISFDYLHSARPDWLQKVQELRIPERLHAPLFALFCVIAALAGAWTIEKHRLTDAQDVEAAYRSRFELSEQSVKKTKIYYDRVIALVSLDRRLREIVNSGDADSRHLAEIANKLPPHAWLMQITRDDTGISLEGRAANLAVVSGVLRSLMGAAGLHDPSLISAQTMSGPANSSFVKYVVHVDGAHS
jgi:Tfp pilus assembly protein PilN